MTCSVIPRISKLFIYSSTRSFSDYGLQFFSSVLWNIFSFPLLSWKNNNIFFFLLFKTIFKFKYILIMLFLSPNSFQILPPPYSFRLFFKKQTKTQHNHKTLQSLENRLKHNLSKQKTTPPPNCNQSTQKSEESITC